jgi:hypothetical protein
MEARHRCRDNRAGRVTVFNTGPQAITANFHPGDIGYVKKAFGLCGEYWGHGSCEYGSLQNGSV